MSYRDFCINFCGREKNIEEIEIKNIENHKFLLGFITAFKNELDELHSGLFAIDPSGIFRPIQDTSQGVVCFCKMPLSRQKVYALHDGYKSVFTEFGKFSIIFPNVFKVDDDLGYSFLNNVSSLYPISATIPANEKIYYTLKTESEIDTASNHSATDDDDDTRKFFLDEEIARRNFLQSKYFNDEVDSDDD